MKSAKHFAKQAWRSARATRAAADGLKGTISGPWAEVLAETAERAAKDAAQAARKRQYRTARLSADLAEFCRARADALTG